MSEFEGESQGDSSGEGQSNSGFRGRPGGFRGGGGGFRGGGFRGGGGGFRGGGGGFRRRFNDGPREMHKTTCAECKKECEVPFKPTEGRPVYCKDCFAAKRDNY